MPDDAELEDRRRIFADLARAMEDPHRLLDLVLGSHGFDDARARVADEFALSPLGVTTLLELGLKRFTVEGRRRMDEERAALEAGE